MPVQPESLEVLEKADTPAATLCGEMAALRGELKAEIHAMGSRVVRHLYLAVLGQMAVMLGFAYFFATNLR